MGSKPSPPGPVLIVAPVGVGGQASAINSPPLFRFRGEGIGMYQSTKGATLWLD